MMFNREKVPISEIELQVDRSKQNRSLMLTSKTFDHVKPKATLPAPKLDLENESTTNKMKSLLS